MTEQLAVSIGTAVRTQRSEYTKAEDLQFPRSVVQAEMPKSTKADTYSEDLLTQPDIA